MKRVAPDGGVRACDRAWEVDALREGRLGDKDVASFERHTAGCGACRRALERDERLREVALALPVEEPTELQLRRLRGRILSDVAKGPRRTRRGWLAVAAAALLIAGSGAAWRARQRPTLSVPASVVETSEVGSTAPTPSVRVPSAQPLSPDGLAGSVAAVDAASWSQRRTGSEERVVLARGTIHVHVRPQAEGERFLVITPDGELEVHGTTFDVTVTAGATSRVHVDEGVVELRLQGRAVEVLAAGATWTNRAPPAPAAARGTQAKNGTSTTAAAAARAYGDAVAQLRDGHDAAAAEALHAMTVAYPRAPQVEDASYLEAVALARTGRADAAALAAEHHLASFPSSFHRREAAILVARAASQRGDCARARAVLAPWLADGGDSDVRTVLRACPGP